MIDKQKLHLILTDNFRFVHTKLNSAQDNGLIVKFTSHNVFIGSDGTRVIIRSIDSEIRGIRADSYQIMRQRYGWAIRDKFDEAEYVFSLRDIPRVELF